MGPKQSREQEEACREKMRRQVEEARRRKRLKKDLAGSDMNVVQMDKIGQIEYNPAENELLVGLDKPKSGRSRKKRTVVEKTSSNSIILV